ncbi:MAG: RimJ/RimL family protein N-acetyltransferase [Saprospiraceae bacterium]
MLWAGHPSKDRHLCSVFRLYFDDAIQSKGALLVTDTQTQQAIGTSRFHDYDAQTSEIEIGRTFLARPYWGGTFNRELKKMMLTHAFQFVEKVILVIEVNNIRSQKAAEKIGGELIDNYLVRSNQVNVVYQLTSVALSKLS